MIVEQTKLHPRLVTDHTSVEDVEQRANFSSPV
jgi:hypothetical protein